MAFLDAVDLMSEASAADAIGATAGDLASSAPNSTLLRGFSEDAKGDWSRNLPGVTIPNLLDPFPGNPALTTGFIVTIMAGGFWLASYNLGTISSLIIIGVFSLIIYNVARKFYKPSDAKATTA